MVRLLLLALFSFLFLSSSTAALLGLQQLRVVLFSMIFLSLLGAAILHAPRFHSRGLGLPLAAATLLAWLFALDTSPEVLDYKIALPILGLLFAANLRRAVDHIPLTPTFLSLLALYIIATSGSFVLGGGNVTERGYDALIRYDLTGSIVTHASLCTIAAIVGMVCAANSRGGRRILALVVVAMAGSMILLTAARTAILTASIYFVLAIAAGPNRQGQVKVLLISILSAAIVFAAYSLLISNAFLLRLTINDNVDFSSGRMHSALFWLALAFEQPLLGHGLGLVRELMAEGRPLIDGGRFLEWPHNEFLRFFVEGGVIGFFLVFSLVLGVMRRAVKYAPTVPPEARALTLMIAADMLAQCMFQNYFNTVYHSTILLTVFAMLCAPEGSIAPKNDQAAAAIIRRTSAGASSGNI